jgi:hypothetical protein
MKTIIISESQLVKLLETAMDLDIYVQPMNYSTSTGNNDLIDSIEDNISKLNELKQMFKTGKTISTESEAEFYNLTNKINKIYDQTKFQDQFTSL